MRRLLREPLLHFLALGALLFVVYGWMNRGREPEAGEIVVTRGRVDNLVASFTRVWQRPPTAAELDLLIRDYVREEVLAREAAALGLDRDDTVIRRRLRQKMEFLADDVSAVTEPTEADLADYLARHPDPFRVASRFTFSQVFLDPTRRGEDLAGDAAQLLALLQQSGDSEIDVASLGDSLLLGHDFQATPADEVAKQFGDAFVTKLATLPVGRWQGPIESGYGTHLVLLRARDDGRVPELAEVRDAVRREWANDQRVQASERFYQRLLERYTVIIEPDGERLAEARG